MRRVEFRTFMGGNVFNATRILICVRWLSSNHFQMLKFLHNGNVIQMTVNWVVYCFCYLVRAIIGFLIAL